jgi:hypothetical protein
MRRHGNRINEVANTFYKKISSKAELNKFDAATNATHFLIVRHPFYRLVSAYRDKLERTLAGKPSNDYYYNLYGKRIVKKYRASAIERFGTGMLERKNNFGSPLAVSKRGKRVRELPTFWEFVQFVKTTP